jgi:hypothetical protein
MVPIVNLDTVGLGFLLPSLTLSRRSFLGFACLGSLFIHDSGDNPFSRPLYRPSFSIFFSIFLYSRSLLGLTPRGMWRSSQLAVELDG